MDILEAERFFKHYDGHDFHMGREEPENYNAFRKLDISDEQKEQWRQEIIEEKLGMLSTPKELSDKIVTTLSAWAIHSQLIDVINKSSTLKKENIEKMADVMKGFTELDLKQKILIVENAAGRCVNDGILRAAYQYGVIPQIKEATDLIIASCYADKHRDGELWERFNNAVKDYSTKLHKYEKLLKKKG